MSIHEIRENALIPVAVTSFGSVGLKERADLQRLLKDKITSLEEGLLVLADEFSWWSDSSRRIDLLCLDTAANLVVVELKRDEDGGHMELQALRYAAMVASMTFDQAVYTLARYRNKANPDTHTARTDLLAHLGWKTPDEGSFAGSTRVILAAADFGKEVTTTVLWLRDYGLDIRCIRLKPYQLENDRLLMDIQRLIPLPEMDEFQTKLGEKRQAERNERTALLNRFLEQLSEYAAQKTNLHQGRMYDARMGELSGSTGKVGFLLKYVIAKDMSRVELLIQREDGRQKLLQLKREQAEIEKAFGGALQWLEKDGVKNCRICFSIDDGYRSPESEWQRIHGELVDAMIRLNAAVRPYLETL